MGKALFESSPAARSAFEEADDALGFAISSLCFDGPADRLLLTENTQPAILTMSVAVLAALREARPELPDPAFVLGHSLGEYSALVAAGALSLTDAVRLVRLRGEAMQDAVPAGEGKMAAIIGGDETSVRQLCLDAAQGASLSPANFNAPGQVVIAGESAAVDRACVLAKERSLKAIPLKVSAPFHCSMMAPAAAKVAAALSQLKVGTPRMPVIANVTAEPNVEASQVAPLLTQQVDHAVLFEHSVRWMTSAGVTNVLELGPGKVLAGLIRKIDKSISVQSVGTPEELANLTL